MNRRAALDLAVFLVSIGAAGLIRIGIQWDPPRSWWGILIGPCIWLAYLFGQAVERRFPDPPRSGRQL